MTIRIPKWLVITLGVALAVGAIAATAFFLGRSTGESDDEKAGDPSGITAVASDLQCSKSDFEDAAVGTRLEAEARLIYSPAEQLIGRPGGFGISPLECSDLTGDGLDEMIGGLAIGASYRTTVYAIFTPGREDWELAFLRSGFVVTDLEPRNGALVERVSTYGVNDPLCCPSGTRTNRIVAEGRRFRVVLGGVARDRGVQVGETTGVTELGPLDLTHAGPTQATAAFGPPTSALASDVDAPTSYLCDFAWADLGLAISFVNLGGQDACSRGLVQSFELEGAPAQQAGWQTADGVRVGMSQRELARLYPFVDDLPASSSARLVQRYSEIGGGGYQDLLTAKLDSGRVVALKSFVGAAGE